MTAKTKAPVTPKGNPRLGGQLQAQNQETGQWDDAEICAVYDMRNGRGQTYKAVQLRGEDAEGPWLSPPIAWHELTWRERR